MQKKTAEPNPEHSQHVIDLLNVTQKAIRKIGYKNLMSQLTRSLANSPIQKEKEKIILHLVSKEFCVSIEDILNSDKRGNVYTAKKMTFVLFKRKLGLSEYRIAKYFDRTAPIICRAVKWFDALNAAYKMDQKLLNQYENILKKYEIEINKVVE